MTSSVTVIGIGGPSGSGKSTVAQLLAKLLGYSIVISVDSFFHPDAMNRDVPESIDIVACLETLAVQTAELERSSRGAPSFLIVEGFLLYVWPDLVRQCQFRFFVACSQETCKQRRFLRGSRSGRWKTSEEFNVFWQKQVWYAFEHYLPLQLKIAQTEPGPTGRIVSLVSVSGEAVTPDEVAGQILLHIHN